MKTQRTFILKLLTLSFTCCIAALAPVSTAWAHSHPPLNTVRVSVSSSGTQGNGDSYGAQLAANGRYVVIESDASNLVVGDNKGLNDIFVHDLKTRRTKRVSVSSTGVEGNSDSWNSLISANGRYVVFISRARNLVAGDDNGNEDIFVHDLQTGMTRRAFDSVAALPQDSEDHDLRILSLSSISNDGLVIAFHVGVYWEVAYVTNLKTGMTQQLSGKIGTYSPIFSTNSPSVSGDGRYVVFVSNNLACPNTETTYQINVFLRNLKTGKQRCVLSNDSGLSGLNLSSNGRYLAYSGSGGAEGTFNLDSYVFDLNTHYQRLVSVNRAGVEGNGRSVSNDISANGHFVAFQSLASDLAAMDNNGASDVFVRDLKAGVTHRVSI